MAERPTELTTASARAQRKALLGDDDATMVFETSKEVTVINTFDQMKLREELLRGIYAYGNGIISVSLPFIDNPSLCFRV